MPVSPASRARRSRAAPRAGWSEADKVSDFTTKKGPRRFGVEGLKGGWLRGSVASRTVRRLAREKSLGARELRADELVYSLAVDALPRKPRHRRLHHLAPVLQPCRAGFGHPVDHRPLHSGRIGRRRQIRVEHATLGGSLVHLL